MKRINFFLTVSVLIIFFSINSNAQFIIGPKFGFNTYHGQVGGGLQAGVIAGDKIKVTLDFMSYSPIENNETTTSPYSSRNETSYFLEFNFNFSYLFKFDKARVYPILGMNIANVDQSVSMYQSMVGSTNTESSMTKVGINIGAGAQYNLGIVSPFVEAKYSISDFENATIGAGILLNIGRNKLASTDSK